MVKVIETVTGNLTFSDIKTEIVSPGGKIIDPNGVNHPSHYNTGKYEVIDVVEDWNLSFNVGNAVKYLARADHKKDPLKDYEKALWYVKRQIELTRKKNAATNT